MALIESIIGGGPHRWIRREARSGTVCVSNSLLMRPRAPFQSVPSGLEIVTATRNFGLRTLKRGDLVRKNEVGRRAAQVDKEDVSGPRPLGEITSDAHHRRDADAGGDENDAVRLCPVKSKFPDRAARLRSRRPS